jgi:UDP-glucose 4-epimerase
MKCLVLGGGGFIGSHLCEELLESGHSVRVFERPGVQIHLPLPLVERLEWREGDITNPMDVEAALHGCSVIFHLVSTTLPKSSNDNPLYDIQTNLLPLVQLLEQLRGSADRKPDKKSDKKIVFVSSGGTVYGRPRLVPIPETHATDPLCAYGITKLACEKYLSLYRELHGVRSVVLRLANPFGERQRPTAQQGAVAVFLHKALADETIEIWGDGEVVRDYLYVKDAARAIVQAMSYEGSQHVFNIGSSQGHSLNAVLSEIEQLLGRPIRVRHTGARSFDVANNVLEISRARAELGWEPTTSFAEGLARTRRWMEAAARSQLPLRSDALTAVSSHSHPDALGQEAIAIPRVVRLRAGKRPA